MAPRFEYAHCRPCRMVMDDMPTNRAASTFGTLRFTWISMQNNHLVSSRQRDTPALPLPAGVLLFDDTARVSHLLALVSRARAFLARLWYRQPQIMAIVFSTNPPPRHPPRLVRLDSSSTPRRSKHGRKKGRTSDLVQTPTSNGPHPFVLVASRKACHLSAAIQSIPNPQPSSMVGVALHNWVHA